MNEPEFRQLVWPDLPAARPERNLPVEFVWNDLKAKSAAGLQQSLSAHGGQRRKLIRIGFEGGTSQGRRSLVHRQSALLVQSADGTEHTIRPFGSVWQDRAGFKVFSWVTD